MATIWPEPRLLFVRDDGEGGGELHVIAQNDDKQVLILTPERAAKLIRDLSTYLIPPPKKPSL